MTKGMQWKGILTYKFDVPFSKNSLEVATSGGSEIACSMKSESSDQIYCYKDFTCYLKDISSLLESFVSPEEGKDDSMKCFFGNEEKVLSTDRKYLNNPS